MGCFVKGVTKEKAEFPRYYKNDLKYSLRELAGNAIVERAFDLSDNQFIDKREEVIEYLINDFALPFLNEISSKEGIRSAFLKYNKLKYYMRIDLKKELGLPFSDDE